MSNRPTNRVQITGLSQEQEDLIKDAARYLRMSVKDLVLAHCAAIMAEAQAAVDRASGRK